MKKTFLLIAALLMMGSAAFAGGGFDLAIGPKVGYQTAKLSYDKADIKSGFANHFTAGVFGRITVGRVYVQPEVLYFKTTNVFNVSVTGTDENENLFNLPTGANANLTLNSMNLQVPILIGVNIIDLDVVTLRAQVGPTANFTLQSKTLFDQTYSIDGTSHNMPEEATTTDQDFDTKAISWGLQAGLGVDVLKRITLDVNYNFGLSKMFGNLNETSLGETFDFNNIDNTKQNMFMVTVGIKLL
ncbi:MAG: PorT family protein [Bacteroidales bacterium]|nr:PorT family protein [Bacteroidales bacterium]